MICWRPYQHATFDLFLRESINLAKSTTSLKVKYSLRLQHVESEVSDFV